MDKIIADCSCDVETALSWAVSARNSLDNNFGYSPNQLVFGINPAFPNVFSDKIPALEHVECSDIVRKNLNAMNIARLEFIKCESNERIKRALKHNIRQTSMLEIQSGDEVYYKRNDSAQWHGPGIVIGRDGKQVIVKHDGMFYRVHACRLTRVPVGETDINQNEDKRSQEKSKEKVNSDESILCDEDEVLHDDDCNKSCEANSNEENTDNQIIENSAQGDATREQVKVKVGQRIQGIISETGEFLSGKLISRAGKSTGKFKNCFNIQKDSDGSIDWIDLDRQFDEWNVVPDEEEMLIFFNSSEVASVKEKELKNWYDNNVFTEVEDTDRKQNEFFGCCDLALDPMTFTSEPDLDIVVTYLHAKK